MSSETEFLIPGKILVLGANGQVGRALTQLLGKQAMAFNRSQVDLSRIEELEKTLDAICESNSGPTALINAAAYTQVDRAAQETELAEAINAHAPGVLAQWCARRGIPFVHYSTDYIFPGTGERPWTEEDSPGSLSVYGASKLRGEESISRTMGHDGKWLIFRTSWVYDANGKNFLTTMVRLGRDREEIKVVADQFGAPTYAPHLAAATLQALQSALSMPKFPSGIYHLCNTGVTTWHGFAEKIFGEARKRGISREGLKIKRVLPIRSEEYPTPAQRPKNSRMSTDKAFKTFGVRLPDWRTGLDDCLSLMHSLQEGTRR